MVYTERTDKYLTSSKDNASDTKSNANSSPSSSCSKPSHSSGAWSNQASNADKWKYNNMVKDNRDKFNGMHFS